RSAAALRLHGRPPANGATRLLKDCSPRGKQVQRNLASAGAEPLGMEFALAWSFSEIEALPTREAAPSPTTERGKLSLDARMSGLGPESASKSAATARIEALGLALESLLEFAGAGCGWIGLWDSVAGLAVPVRRGAIPEVWLEHQLGRDSIWGIAFRDGPTLLNDLPPWPGPGASALQNLLSCPVMGQSGARGCVVLANKTTGFKSHDAAV